MTHQGYQPFKGRFFLKVYNWWAMKLIEVGVLICFFSFFFFYQRVEHTGQIHVKKQTATTQEVIEEVSDSAPVFEEVSVNYVMAPAVSHEYQEREEVQDDLPEFDHASEKIWKENVYYHLRDVDPQNADGIYTQFKNEDEKHQESLNENLSISLNRLSGMNGESGYGDAQMPEDEDYRPRPVPAMVLEERHQTKVKHILGQNYEYIKEKEMREREESGF
jgi:hypothetical protein